jgi:hypothetical protein
VTSGDSSGGTPSGGSFGGTPSGGNPYGLTSSGISLGVSTGGISLGVSTGGTSLRGSTSGTNLEGLFGGGSPSSLGIAGIAALYLSKIDAKLYKRFNHSLLRPTDSNRPECTASYPCQST